MSDTAPHPRAFGDVTIRRADGTVETSAAYDTPTRNSIVHGANVFGGARRGVPPDGTGSASDIARRAGRSPDWVRERARLLGGVKDGRGHWRFRIDDAVSLAAKVGI